MSECDAANPPTPINILGVSIYWNAFVTESSINKNGTRGTHFMHDAFFPSLFKCNPHLLLKEQERDQELKRRTILKKTASVTGSYVRMGSKKAPKVYYWCRVKSTKQILRYFISADYFCAHNFCFLHSEQKQSESIESFNCTRAVYLSKH